MSISVLCINEDPVFQDCVRALLNASGDYCIVGEFMDELEATIQIEHLRPDVVVLNGLLSYVDGLTVLSWLRKQQPLARVVMISPDSDDAYVLGAIQNGAFGYILPEDIVTHLIPAVKAAAAGLLYFSPSLRRNIRLPDHPEKPLLIDAVDPDE